jgi:DNA-directed RNA polymerase specialized sigma24 family protein
MMVALDGLSYDAAAKRLGVPLGTIRSRLFRARANLQLRIDPEGELAASRHGRAGAESHPADPH